MPFWKISSVSKNDKDAPFMIQLFPSYYLREKRAFAIQRVIHKCQSTYDLPELEIIQISIYNEWINELWFIHKIENYLVIKRNEL